MGLGNAGGVRNKQGLRTEQRKRDKAGEDALFRVTVSSKCSQLWNQTRQRLPKQAQCESSSHEYQYLMYMLSILVDLIYYEQFCSLLNKENYFNPYISIYLQTFTQVINWPWVWTCPTSILTLSYHAHIPLILSPSQVTLIKVFLTHQHDKHHHNHPERNSHSHNEYSSCSLFVRENIRDPGRVGVGGFDWGLGGLYWWWLGLWCL